MPTCAGRLGKLEWLITSPAFHHWHHTPRAGMVNHNYATMLPWVDRIFGTHHLPQEWPEAYGITDRMPETLPEQLVYPLLSQPHVPTAAQANSSETIVTRVATEYSFEGTNVSAKGPLCNDSLHSLWPIKIRASSRTQSLFVMHLKKLTSSGAPRHSHRVSAETPKNADTIWQTRNAMIYAKSLLAALAGLIVAAAVIVGVAFIVLKALSTPPPNVGENWYFVGPLVPLWLAGGVPLLVFAAVYFLTLKKLSKADQRPN